MKRVICVCLILTILCSLCGCGSNKSETTPKEAEKESTVQSEDSTEATEAKDTTPLWGVSQATDEFGDVTDDSPTVVSVPISGTFSNTATSGSELSGSVYIVRNPLDEEDLQGHWLIFFQLLEYNNTKATYSSSSEMILKTKGKSNSSSYERERELVLGGQAPNGDIWIAGGVNKTVNKVFHYNSDSIVYDLRDGYDIHCLVYIDSSKYDFWIYHDGFEEAMESIGGTHLD